MFSVGQSMLLFIVPYILLLTLNRKFLLTFKTDEKTESQYFIGFVNEISTELYRILFIFSDFFRYGTY